MSAATDALKSAWRYFTTDNIPASGYSEPSKREIQAGFDLLALELVAAVGGFLRYGTIEARDAATGVATGALAYVYKNNGSTSDAANKFYQKTASGWEDAVWFNNLITAILSDILSDTSDILDAIDFPVAYGNRVPLFFDNAGNVPVWLENGKLDVAQGFSDRLLALIAPKSVGYDGSSLYQFHARLAQFKAAGTAKMRVMMMGDSWAEQAPLSTALATVLRAATANGGGGWISVNSNTSGLEPLDGASFTRNANWTLFDAAPNDFPQVIPATGVAHDGFALTSTLTNGTASFVTASCTAFRLFYGKATGTFRYRVDSGSWTAVTGDGSNDLGTISVTGLSAATHTIDIDTTGNAGTAVIYGLHFYNATAGVEVLKCGNGNLAGNQLATYAETWIAPILDVIAPDVIIWPLGTNDYRNAGNTPQITTTALDIAVDAIRAVLPDIGFIFIAPADTDGTAVIPLVEYRDAMEAFCIAKDCAFYNMHDDWGSWASENALGMFDDALHPGTTGGRRVAETLLSRFLSL